MTDPTATEEGVRAARVLQSLGIPSQGRIYDLDAGRFPGMPLWEGHPPWQLVGYRTPQGLRVQGDQDWLSDEHNPLGIGIVTDLLIAGMHSGAHIDSLAHITCGPDAHWHGGTSAADKLGDFGPLTDDASTIAPIVSRGVLVDVAASLGYERLPAHYPISLEEFEEALRLQGTTIQEGDVVLVRTGQMAMWRNPAGWAETPGAGITLPVAERLIELGVRAVGGDTETVEVMPSIIPGNPHPVHLRLIVEEGIHLMECLDLEQLAADRVYEFLYVALAPKIAGATAALLRPIAIV